MLDIVYPSVEQLRDIHISYKGISDGGALVTANINLVLPCFEKLVIDYEKGLYNFCIRFFDSVGVVDHFQKGKSSILDHIKESFELLDTVLDEENIEAVGRNYNEKYNLLKKDTDYEIIFSQIYRILTVFRNAIIHEPKSIIRDSGNISIKRKNKKGKDIKLVVKDDIIKFILAYPIYYNNVRTIKLNECYRINIALWYYSKIIAFISEYIDDGDKIKLIQTKNKTIFAEIARFICENIRCERLENRIEFNIKQDHLFSLGENRNPIDFVFSIDNRFYMIPFEIVPDGNIFISDLRKFEINEDISEYVNKLYNGFAKSLG